MLATHKKRRRGRTTHGIAALVTVVLCAALLAAAHLEAGAQQDPCEQFPAPHFEAGAVRWELAGVQQSAIGDWHRAWYAPADQPTQRTEMTVWTRPSVGQSYQFGRSIEAGSYVFDWEHDQRPCGQLRAEFDGSTWTVLPDPDPDPPETVPTATTLPPAPLAEKVEQLETTVEGLADAQELAELEDKVEALEQKESALETTVEGLAADVGMLEDKVEALEQHEAAVPMPPTGLRAELHGSVVHLDWEQHPDSSAEILVHRRALTRPDWVHVETLPAGSTSWQDSGTDHAVSRKWVYRLTAQTSAGSSGMTPPEGIAYPKR